MTECERLVQEGVFKAEFFKEEIRNDFKVDVNRKKIWAIEIDLILQLDRVCKKNNLKYWLCAGSLLGAMRHNGFIPWDDDMDVFMPRNDYEKLLTLREEFKKPYFLQTPYTDSGFFFAFSRLRNSNTTYISEVFRNQDMNHGIPIDIFPLDEHIPTENSEHQFNEILKLIIDNSTYMRMSYPKLSSKDKERVKNYSGGDPLKRYELIQQLCCIDNGKNCEHYWMPSGGVYGYKRDVFFKEDFKTTKYVAFEDKCFPVPNGAENILQIVYGDWKQLPSVDKRYAWGGADYFNADVSYSDYLVDLSC